MDKVFIVLPAYNADRTLEKIYNQIPKKYSVLLCDDGSEDKTKKISKKLGIQTLIHTKNKGYGANQKTLYTNALKIGADYIIMLHPDGQYNPLDLPKFVRSLEKGADIVLGSRFLGLTNQTPFYKSISIRFITFLYNLVFGTKLTEINSGYRGYSKRFLETVPFEKNGNGYIFDPQMLVQAYFFSFKIHEVSVSKIYNNEASTPNLEKSLKHGLENIELLIEYLFHKLKLKRADFLSI